MNLFIRRQISLEANERFMGLQYPERVILFTFNTGAYLVINKDFMTVPTGTRNYELDAAAINASFKASHCSPAMLQLVETVVAPPSMWGRWLA